MARKVKRKASRHGYAERYLRAIRAAKADRAILDLINKIYQDGFCDGASEGRA